MGYSTRTNFSIAVDSVVDNYVGPINREAVKAALRSILPRRPDGTPDERITVADVKKGIRLLRARRPDFFTADPSRPPPIVDNPISSTASIYIEAALHGRDDLDAKIMEAELLLRLPRDGASLETIKTLIDDLVKEEPSRYLKAEILHRQDPLTRLKLANARKLHG